MATLGFWEQGNEITYFKGTRDNFRIKLREQAIFLQFKGTLTKYFREQWNILPGKRLSLFIVGLEGLGSVFPYFPLTLENQSTHM